jgi:prohibitin 1
VNKTGNRPAERTVRKAPTLVLALVLIAVAFGSSGCGTKIPAGYNGVLYKLFDDGVEMGAVYTQGFNWHFPWNTYYLYSIQLQERKEALDVLSSDGATIRLDVSLLFRVDATKIDSLHVGIGRDFYNQAIAPNLRGVARSIVGQYKPEEIYSSKRDQIALEVVARLSEALSDKFIVVENVIFRDVTLPKRITDAINAKLEASQEAEKMEFVLQKEKLEADRKRIEAKGIADFQKIVSSGLTPQFLRWKGIEAT